MQALWTAVLAPVIRVNAPLLIDLVCHQHRLLCSFVTGLQLLALEVGTRAPRLAGACTAMGQASRGSSVIERLALWQLLFSWIEPE